MDNIWHGIALFKNLFENEEQKEKKSNNKTNVSREREKYKVCQEKIKYREKEKNIDNTEREHYCSEREVMEKKVRERWRTCRTKQREKYRIEGWSANTKGEGGRRDCLRQKREKRLSFKLISNNIAKAALMFNSSLFSQTNIFLFSFQHNFNSFVSICDYWIG